MEESKPGLTAWETWEVLFPQEPHTDSVHPFAGGFSRSDARMDKQLLKPLVNSLLDGSWHATGYESPVKSRQPKRVPQDFWNFLVLDPDADTAKGGGKEFVGLQFFETTTPNLKSRSDAQGKCEVWIRNLDEPPTDKAACREEALAAIEGLSGRAFDRAWGNAAPADWKEPGAKKKD